MIRTKNIQLRQIKEKSFKKYRNKIVDLIINELFQFGLQQIVHKIQSIKLLINAKAKIKNSKK